MLQLIVHIKLETPASWSRFECVKIALSERTEGGRIMLNKKAVLLGLTQRGRGLALSELSRRTEVTMLHVQDRVVVVA